MSSPARLPAFRTFREDLRQSLRAWGVEPRLPLLSLAIEAGPYIVTAISYGLAGYPGCNSTRGGCGFLFGGLPFVLMIFSLVFAGWFGAQRIIYMRAFEGRHLEKRELWPLISAFRGRYIVLGIVFGITAIIPGLFVGLLLANQVHPGIGITVFIAFTVAIDAAMTFVTPALAFSTRKVSQAIRMGFKLSKRTWPASALYLFVPPLALRAAAATFAGQRSIVIFAIVADTLSVLLLVWFKGATARFYLRFNETGKSGAAFPEKPEEVRG